VEIATPAGGQANNVGVFVQGTLNFGIAGVPILSTGSSSSENSQHTVTINGVPIAIDRTILFEPNPNTSDGLPAWQTGVERQPTYGRLEIDNQLLYIRSGAGLPGEAVRGLSNARSWMHVEGHVASIMRQAGISRAKLTINNPNGVCQPCRGNVPGMLPRGARLNVQYPNGAGGYAETPIEALE
jgi:hypothetical protein